MTALSILAISLAFSMFPAELTSTSAPPVECSVPHALRLERFEDGSARLECGGRPLVRVSVPG